MYVVLAAIMVEVIIVVVVVFSNVVVAAVVSLVVVEVVEAELKFSKFRLLLFAQSNHKITFSCSYISHIFDHLKSHTKQKLFFTIDF